MFHGWEYLSRDAEDRITAGVLSGNAHAGPFHLELQPTNRCNARCTFCCTAHFRHSEELPWSYLEKTLREEAARDLHFVRVIGGGEPLLYPQVREMYRVLSELPLKGTDLVTNGILLEKYAEDVM